MTLVEPCRFTGGSSGLVTGAGLVVVVVPVDAGVGDGAGAGAEDGATVDDDGELYTCGAVGALLATGAEGDAD